MATVVDCDESGLYVDVMAVGFVPAEEVAMEGDWEELVGKQIPVTIAEFDPESERIVLSHKKGERLYKLRGRATVTFWDEGQITVEQGF